MNEVEADEKIPRLMRQKCFWVETRFQFSANESDRLYSVVCFNFFFALTDYKLPFER